MDQKLGEQQQRVMTASFPAPHVSVWGEEKHGWVEFPDTIRQFARDAAGG